MTPSIRTSAGVLRSLGDHWYEWSETEPAAGEIRVHAVVQDDGRFHLDVLEYRGPVSAAALRAIPVGRIEAAVNSMARHGHVVDAIAVEVVVPEQLRMSEGPAYPDAFYEAVAGAYRHLAASSRRPIADLAAANGVPSTTAQRWVKEARRRELLPPGRKGKAG